MKTIKDVSYGKFSENKLDMYLPETANFHGGGLTSCKKSDDAYVSMASDFVDKGYAFISVEYRMYPTAKCPDFINDCALAVAWVKENLKNYGASGEIYVSGQSAGAWLALMLCLNENYLKEVGVSPMEIKGWIIDSAQITTHFNVLKFEKGLNPDLQRIDEYAPIYFVNEETKFTKMLTLFYENDIPCRAEQNMLFIKAVKHFNKNANLEYKQLEGWHCKGSQVREDDGEYAYVKESLRWLAND